MRNKASVLAIGAIIVLAIGLYAAAFTVNLRETALVLQFGEPKRVLTEPGLYFRVPVIESVTYLDKRVRNFDVEPQLLLTREQKRVLISAFVRYQIVDPLKFYQVAKTTMNAEGQIGSVLISTLRSAVGNTPMTDILTPKRAELMSLITQELTRQAAAPYGIRIVDVRFQRVDLPPQNSEAVFTQMRSQRAQEAAGIRADGARRALELKAEADKERVVTLAEAQRKSSITRGEGDAEATRIYNEAYSQDPKFFDFYRSMQAMQLGLGGDNTTFVGAPTGDFFRFFDREGTAEAPAKGPAPAPQSPAPTTGPE
ncbi:protease modulator HflC [Dongia sedimenti]|uniref:Protein HflC n=1 Tax=Dongia sedimenti TaxID=3064282 RepID=A0ABU0YG00_9PROT|nr:protease modulator HflC [Rhodospirillaceae bacterium R-7]